MGILMAYQKPLLQLIRENNFEGIDEYLKNCTDEKSQGYIEAIRDFTSALDEILIVKYDRKFSGPRGAGPTRTQTKYLYNQLVDFLNAHDPK